MKFKDILLIMSTVLCVSRAVAVQRPAPQRVNPALSQAEDVSKHRSAVCLINQLAQKNNITAKYNYIALARQGEGAPATPRPQSFEYQLTLGDESYTKTASDKRNAKEGVSREAYDKTRYPKPHLKDRTCVENALRSNVSLLYEYATTQHKGILDKVIHESTLPNKFRVELKLDDKEGIDTGFSIKQAKAKAAEKLIAMIGREHILSEITKKFNDPEFFEMKNAERLQRILYARGESEPKFELDAEMQSSDGRTTNYVYTASGSTMVTSGSGNSEEDAREDAARNYLKSLGFEVRTASK